ncbi:MAG: Peptidoglycan-binding domain of peptidoglycan hydrolase-containing protein [Marmoricola sp.]|nr:Peptidoglycan-binding domain of peptidoglycan hydrolase-containing protein [Marmoricola sp.]
MLTVATLTTTLGSLAPAGAATTPPGGSAGDPAGTTVLFNALRAVAAPVAVPRAPVATAGSTPEALAAYVPANSCDPTAKPGTKALGELLKATYAGSSYGIDRTCGTDPLPTSEHYDGRAVDFFRNVRVPAQKAQLDGLVAWMLAPDAAGRPYANARRLGVMYLIWNNRIWGSYRPGDGWRPYSSCASHPEAAYDTTCHRNHLHVSLSWEGAMGRTSFWTGRTATPDFGPCRASDLNWASPYRVANPGRCPSYPEVTAQAGSTALHRTLVTYSGMRLTAGSTGPVVRAVQQALHTGVDGSYGAATRTAVNGFQAAHRVPVTGVVDDATWRALLTATAPKATPAPTPTPPAPTTPVPTTGSGTAPATTPTTKPADPLRAYQGVVLRRGSRGPAVVALQRRLRLTADGWFGPRTAAAVRTFQRRHHLRVTGVVDARTWRALSA